VELLLGAKQLSVLSLLANPSQEAGAKVAKVPEDVLNAVASASMGSWTHPPSKRLELTTVLASRNAQLNTRSIKVDKRGTGGIKDGNVRMGGWVESPHVWAQNRLCPSAFDYVVSFLH